MRLAAIVLKTNAMQTLTTRRRRNLLQQNLKPRLHIGAPIDGERKPFPSSLAGDESGKAFPFNFRFNWSFISESTMGTGSQIAAEESSDAGCILVFIGSMWEKYEKGVEVMWERIRDSSGNLLERRRWRLITAAVSPLPLIRRAFRSLPVLVVSWYHIVNIVVFLYVICVLFHCPTRSCPGGLVLHRERNSQRRIHHVIVATWLFELRIRRPTLSCPYFIECNRYYMYFV